MVLDREFVDVFTLNLLIFQELKLRRCAVTVLAFIASLGKAGLGIILNHRLPERTNILASILESLASDVNLEPLDSAQSVEVFRERFVNL